MINVIKLFKYKKNIILFLILIALVMLAIYFSQEKPPAVQPVAKQGYLDLSGWDFDKNGSVNLDGQWEFYWDRLAEPSELESSLKPEGYMKVPAVWKEQIRNSIPASTGSATYRLKVKVPDGIAVYGLKTNNIRMSCKLYVNGILAGSSGNPAKTLADGYISSNVPFLSFFQNTGDTLDVVIQTANLDYATGGIIQKITFGTSRSILWESGKDKFLDILCIACLILTGIYYLGIYWGMKKDRSIWFFGAFCLLFSFVISLNNEKMLLQLFPQIPYVPVIRMKYIAIGLCVILLCSFVREKGWRFLPTWFMKCLYAVSGLNFLFIVFVPMKIYSNFDNLFLLTNLLFLFLSCLFLFKHMIKKDCGALKPSGVFLLAISVLMIVIHFLCSILYISSVIHSISFAVIPLIFFLLIISGLLSRQYSDAYNTIEAMSIELQAVDKLKDEFLTNTSHELKTPLNGIINLTQSVLFKTGEQLEPPLQEDLRMVVAAGQRLSSLVNDILDISCLKRGEIKLSRKAMNVRAAASVVLHIMEHLKQEKQIRLINSIPEDLPYVEADEERLRQIYYNLIGNALKFTQSGSIETGGRQLGGMLELWVRDTGCGIPEDRQEDIFKAFYQIAQAEQGENQGTGLGLSITKQLVELHGGKIWVASDPGEGSKFIFTLPVSKGEKVEEITCMNHLEISRVPAVESFLPKEAEKKEGKFTILVAEDDATNLRALLTLLDSEEYFIKAVTDGQQVLDELDRQPNYDLLILDVMMPRLTGYQVLESVRRRFSGIELPVILLTAKARQQDIQAGFDAGANDYITKPFEAGELKSRVSTLVQLKKSVNSLIAAELNFLQAQIKPHFLYNALSVITSLSIREPKQAKELLMHLSDYLRGSFNFENHSGFISISEELQTVQAYIAIEEARFEERLKVEYDVDQDISISIPMLCLQPIVENAVRHGIMKCEKGGTVKVSVKAVEDQIIITVEDDGVGMTKERLSELFVDDEAKGVGIRNIHKRMLAMYGHGLQIESAPDWGTRVTMVVPGKPMKGVEA